MLASIVAWFFVLALGGLHDQLQWLVVVTVEACSLAVLALLVYAAWNFRAPPIGVSTTEQGLTFLWGSGKAELVPWNRLTRNFVLLDYSVNPTVVTLIPEFQWEVRRWNRPPTPLTKPAFDAVLGEAAAHGLTLVTRDMPNPWQGWAPCRATRFSRST